MVSQAMSFFSLLYFSSFLLVMSCNDWFLIWMGLEINMISFIALIFNYSMFNVESCMKYFFVQSLGSALLMVMFYLSLNYLSYVMIFILSYKIGAGPFFFWFPSVCSGISWSSCFLLMTFQKILPLLIISLMVNVLLWILSAVSMIIGAFGSMNQKSLKRLLAYSSIHHIGWMYLVNFYDSCSWMMYLIVYMMMLFSVVILLSSFEIMSLEVLKGVSNKWLFVMSMLSMGGLPPFLGFFLKWWVFLNLMMMSKIILVLMIMMSVLMFYVYLRIVFSLLVKLTMEKSWSKFMISKINFNGVMLIIMGMMFGPFMILI
uniref:NADH-ubiquinone oxidoreductase chain 2 n=1 Tax=Trichonephila clavata TaxID=2740835 RepID=Q1JQQ6_TRICU|nr:NADH dehydrogenase subunit 2 [Trichonephila clavata]AAS15719.1 NADH dehydrogenase subunit 2 [Trichonephila clavata]